VRTRILYFFLFCVLVLLDQWTKLTVASNLYLGETRSLLGNVLQLTYVRNPGAAFSVSFGGPQIMFVITIAVISLLIYLWIRGAIRPESLPGRIALLMVFAGAAGNMIDRIRMGEVIDFIEMGVGNYHWPIYNFADIYITLGMCVLFYLYAVKKDAPRGTDDTAAQ
jgi:signal peptidase II